MRKHLGASALTGSIFASALLGYVLLAVIARALTPDAYAQFQVAWAVLFGVASTLSVIEQDVSRAQASADARGQEREATTLQTAVVATGWLGVVGAVVLLSGLGSRLFGDLPAAVTAAVVVATCGFIPQFTVRGVLVGRRQLGAYSLVILAEPLLRLAGLGIALLLAAHVAGFVGAVAAGSFAWLVVLRSAGRYLGGPREAAWSSLCARVGLLGVGTAAAAALITGYPALVKAVLGTSVGLGTVFAVITASRIPLIFIAPLQAVTVPTVVRLIEAGRVARLRRVLALGGIATVGLALAGYAVGWLIGPWVVTVLFGPQYIAARAWVGAVAAATVVLGAQQLAAACLIALQRYVALALVWCVGIGASVGALWVSSDPVSAVIAGLAAGAVGALLPAAAVLGYSVRELREPARGEGGSLDA